ncbi:MAG: hypothetical protein U9Q95_04330, partial [Candidatus Eisenbacteria bacterium]|nr:hypothetical protein [Candidatus Eisenbacteria bacterium]
MRKATVSWIGVATMLALVLLLAFATTGCSTGGTDEHRDEASEVDAHEGHDHGEDEDDHEVEEVDAHE